MAANRWNSAPGEHEESFSTDNFTYKVFLGFKTLVKPGEAWRELASQHLSATDLSVYLMLLMPLAFLARASGRAIAGWAFTWSVLESFLFFFLLAFVTLGCAVLVSMFAGTKKRWAIQPFALMVYSSTPLWVLSLFYLIPVVELYPYIFLLSFGYAGYLLFIGLPTLFHTDAHQTLLVASLATTMWIITATIFCQLFLIVGFSSI